MIVSDDKVKEIRDGRAKQQQAAQNAEMMAQVAPAAKAGAEAAAVLSDVRNAPTGGNLLSSLGIAG
jgi:hypothetical protein